VDETSFLRATRDRSPSYAIGLVDLDERILIELVEGNTCGGPAPMASDLVESWRAAGPGGAGPAVGLGR
jgi:hypothetical protein